MDDVRAINNHKGFKVVWNPGRLRSAFNKLNPENMVVMIGNGIESSVNESYKVKHVNIEIKDFSMFKANTLGPCVYWYLGNSKSRGLYGYDQLEMIKSRIPFHIIDGFQGHDMDYVKEQYYDKCFVNVKPIIHGGLTSATELAFMGRKTISNTKAPFCVGYADIDHMVDLIMEESKKIGTIQPDLASSSFESTDAWRYEQFWT